MIPDDVVQSREALLALVLEVVRLNGRLLGADAKVISKLGLTGARWRILNAIGMSPVQESVARLSRTMGTNRQGIQQIVNELAKDGLLTFRNNPDHRRARLVILTEKGTATYEAAALLQEPWAEALSKGLDIEQVKASTELLAVLRGKLDDDAAKRGAWGFKPGRFSEEEE